MCLGISSPLEHMITSAKNIPSVPKGREITGTFILAVIMGTEWKQQEMGNNGVHSLQEEQLGTPFP